MSAVPFDSKPESEDWKVPLERRKPRACEQAFRHQPALRQTVDFTDSEVKMRRLCCAHDSQVADCEGLCRHRCV